MAGSDPSATSRGFRVAGGHHLDTANVFHVMTRLKIHHMADEGTARADISARCDVPHRSVQRMLAEPVPTLAEVRADVPRLGRPAKADDAMAARAARRATPTSGPPCGPRWAFRLWKASTASTSAPDAGPRPMGLSSYVEDIVAKTEGVD